MYHRRVVWTHSTTPALVLLLGLAVFAPPSEAAPVAPRKNTTTKAANRAPPPRREIKLSPEVRQRLSRPTVTRKPVRHVPLSKGEVRRAVPTSERPKRAKINGKTKRLSNSELTRELNEIERKLNSQGYTLRDRRTVLYHEHRPDRAKLKAQTRRVRAVADTRPKRAPLTGDQLRAKVRASAKPPTRQTRKTPGRSAAPPGFWTLGPTPSASVDFDWTPTMGEPELGSAYLDTRAHFAASADGSDAGLHGSIMVKAGGYVLGDRVDLARLDTTVDGTLDGSYSTEITATLVGGFEYSIYSDQGQRISYADQLDLFDYEQTFHTKVLIVGYPIDIELTVSPSIGLGVSTYAGNGYVFSSLAPDLRVDVTLEAYFDMLLAEVGAGGSAVLIEATPELAGGASFSERDGQTIANASLSGWVDFKFLEGRIYAFVELGWWIFTTRFEWELWDYDGWSYSYPLFRWDSSAEP